MIQEISQFSEHMGYLSIPNKLNCKIFYEHCQGSDTVEISLYDLLLKNKFPIENFVQTAWLLAVARRHNVNINKIIFFDNNNLISSQISSFRNINYFIYVPNKQKCKIIYTSLDSGLDMEISFADLWRKKKVSKG